MFAAADGNQQVDFYWIDPIEAIKRYVAKAEYSGKMYTKYEPGTNRMHPGQRAFDSRANSGMTFEAAQLIDMNSTPVLALFFADASFTGNMTHHPIYCEYYSLFDLFEFVSIIKII